MTNTLKVIRMPKMPVILEKENSARQYEVEETKNFIVIRTNYLDHTDYNKRNWFIRTSKGYYRVQFVSKLTDITESKLLFEKLEELDEDAIKFMELDLWNIKEK